MKKNVIKGQKGEANTIANLEKRIAKLKTENSVLKAKNTKLALQLATKNLKIEKIKLDCQNQKSKREQIILDLQAENLRLKSPQFTKIDIEASNRRHDKPSL